MEQLDLDVVKEFANENIIEFHQARLKRLRKINLKDVLKKKNPYLFKAKNILKASDLIESILDAFLSSSEEKLFGDFLEKLATFVANQTTAGHKSAVTGIDLEFIDDGVHYLVSIKSGPSWGNSSQYKSLRANFDNTIKVLKQQNKKANVQPVLGICYGKGKTTFLGNYMKIMGQNFWFLISGNKNLYTDIIEPLGYKAKTHNDSFKKEKAKIINKFTREFIDYFCNPDGEIDWKKLVQFNSGNLAEQI
jgi:hypothetical protein